MKARVVVTGLGVCAPNGISLLGFCESLKNGVSGIEFNPQLAELNFGCQVSGTPKIDTKILNKYFTKLELRGLKSSGLMYGVIAGVEAWKDADLYTDRTGEVDWETGVVFGTGILGVDKFREAIHLIDDKQTRRLGSTSVIQTMASGISAFLGGRFGLGNQVTTNSSACTTGTEGVLMAFDRISQGKAKRMLVGSCSDSGPYVWGGFDALRVLARNSNAFPEKASRPFSASATGFVPGSGAGALVIESLESALERKATIYAEVLGGAVNSGGQRNGGSMTAPNNKGVQRCITTALKEAGVSATEVDAINGHLTATSKDPVEIMNWSEALDRKGSDFPYINSFKGIFGHCLAASGSVECVGTLLQFKEGKIFGNINTEDIHPEISQIIAKSRIPHKTIELKPKIIAKASFGFGDVNACVIFKSYPD
ncbi:beta-ketoacyl-[acyl-carrier-protein] synthase family protein [Eudoraea chungangensis]|uniref:beta-ketoacyl-[acyl-carrier-protein] synthase family protein n=1 Tax=Eudoraea chungangensis TaxID=1481905 RepID=UPI0023EDC7AE|nr:beta-ketoacyl-[acyl-carrier-protein] synthase family protein [Eudoraea chungangensis]